MVWKLYLEISTKSREKTFWTFLSPSHIQHSFSQPQDFRTQSLHQFSSCITTIKFFTQQFALLLRHHSISFLPCSNLFNSQLPWQSLSASISLTTIPRCSNFSEYKSCLLHSWPITRAPSISLSFLHLLSQTLLFSGWKNSIDGPPLTDSTSLHRDSPALISRPFLITVVISLSAKYLTLIKKYRI